MYMRSRQTALRLATGLSLLLLSLLGAAGPARADDAIAHVHIDAQVQPDGSVLLTEERTIPNPRAAEFTEYLLPPGADLQIAAVQDDSGRFAPGTADSVQLHQYHLERQGQVIYLEWHPNTWQPEHVTITYKLTGGLIVHKDAVEWYWPALTGSGGRTVAQVDATIHLPRSAPAYLYAYGGDAGGVRVAGNTLQAAASNVRANRPFEWRLLVSRTALPDVQGMPGASDLATLRQIEQSRVGAEMSVATRRWLAHWLFVLSPLVLLWLYFATIRRRRPDPAPEALGVSDLLTTPPAVVGWVYDSSPLDIAVAQLMYLQRRGDVFWRFRHGGEHPDHEGDPLELVVENASHLGAADQSLIEYFNLSDGKLRTAAEISDSWRYRPGKVARERAWLKAVAAEVPMEWLDRPSLLPALLICAGYALFGLVSGGWLEWLLLWAVAAVAGWMATKRRWLSALGEAHVARWVSLYWSAVQRFRSTGAAAVPREIPAEYLLAVEVGDEALERQMGKERYAVVKALYYYLEPEG